MEQGAGAGGGIREAGEGNSTWWQGRVRADAGATSSRELEQTEAALPGQVPRVIALLHFPGSF